MKVNRRGITQYTSYNFIDKDPVIDEVRAMIDIEGVTLPYIENKSGVSRKTLRDWFVGPTKRPQAATVRAVARSLGYDFYLMKGVRNLR